MEAPPSERWELLLQCDWEAFIATSPKTFREERWWGGLLAGNRRVFLLHAVSFGGVVILTRPPSWSAYFNGWGSAFLAVAVLALAPLSSASGAIFELWSTGEARARTALKKQLGFTLVLAAPLLAAAAGLVALQSSHSLDELESTDLASRTVVGFLLCGAVVVVLGVAWLVREMRPTAHLRMFDSHLQWEARTSSLAWSSWLVPRSWCELKPEVASIVRMHAFWALVWLVKNLLALFVLVPTLFDVHSQILASFSEAAYAEAHPLASVWSYLSQPSQLLRSSLVGALWAAGALAYLADTLFWYSLAIGVIGGTSGLAAHGVAKSAWSSVPSASSLERAAHEKLLQGGTSPSAAAWRTLWHAVVDELYRSDLLTEIERRLLLQGDERVHVANDEARRRLHFFERSLDDARLAPSIGALRAPGMTVLVPHYAETILVPYDALTGGGRTVGTADAASDAGKAPRKSYLDPYSVARQDSAHRSLLGFLVAYAADEWRNFESRLERQQVVVTRPSIAAPVTVDSAGGEHAAAEEETRAWRFMFQLDDRQSTRGGAAAPATAPPAAAAPSCGTTNQEAAHAATRAQKATTVRVWASLRLQTLYRTLTGMMKNRTATTLLLRAALPALPEEDLVRLVDLKFKCVAALQRYAQMSPTELDDVEYLLAEHPSLTIAYIDEETSPAGGSVFYSCLVDGHCLLGSDGRRRPRFRVELPGHPSTPRARHQPLGGPSTVTASCPRAAHRVPRSPRGRAPLVPTAPGAR